LSDFAPDSFDEDHHFWTPVAVPGGTIKLFKVGPPATPWLTVLDNDEHLFDEALYVAMDTALDVYDDGEYLLRDDDWEDLPGKGSAKAPPVDLSSPHCLKTDIVTNAMAYAYVTVEQYGEVQVSQFRLNVELNEVNWASENLNAASSSQFWVAHMTAAFQGRQNGDADRETDFSLGASLPGHSGHCYLETIREWWANGPTLRSIEENEAENVAHEVGHQFGLDHPPYGVYGTGPWYYIMAGEEDLGQHGDRDFQIHEPPALAAIRNSDHPVVEP
jgi:hypothetical protein